MIPTSFWSRIGKKFWRFISSVRLAVLLLVVLIVSIALGTIYESNFDSKVARAYIYDAPWFNGWMLLLGINLAAAAFSRYPWKKHHTGFVMTHAGIITLLIGAIVGRIWGIEGTMTLFIGHEPNNRLIVDQQEVRVQEGDQIVEFPVELKHQHARPEQPVFLGNTPGGWKLDIIDYADFLLPINKPREVTTGGTPSLQIKLWSAGMPQQIEEWLWPKDPENNKVDMGLLAVECRMGTAPATLSLPAGDRAVVFFAPEGKITYFIQNKKGQISQGVLEPGKPLSTGWGNWQMEVEQVMPQAELSTEFKSMAKNAKMAPRDRMNLTPGVKVRFSRGQDHDEEWIASGWQVELPAEHEIVQASYGPKVLALPISLELKHFMVERNEGTDTPAAFKSSLQVSDAVGNSAEGSCSMNEPMNFPDTFWRRWTGLTYKISQASWNPQNLEQSSVQILLDPGWLFKWSGSLLICAGIFTMFYLRPVRDIHHQ